MFDKAAFVKMYTPLLVLYPEIPQGTTREGSWDPNYLDEPPLPYDYHPRDIRIVLENAGFHARIRLWGKGKKSTWRKMLDRMEGKKYKKNLDLLPGVRADKRDKFWEEYARIIQRDNDDHRHACYARVVPGTGANQDRVLVQYWYPYFYNDFWNAHEMDWECVMIVFKTTDEDPIPTVCACSAHHKGSWLPWSGVDIRDDTHPVIYVAHGSHAGYFYGGRKYITAPEVVANAARGLNRENRGLADFTTSRDKGSPLQVEARLIPEPQGGMWSGEWRWLNHMGRWGSPGDWDLEFGDSGPYGPPPSWRQVGISLPLDQ